jgi:hypothetical protein
MEKAIHIHNSGFKIVAIVDPRNPRVQKEIVTEDFLP